MSESILNAQITCNEIPRVSPVRYPLQGFGLELEIKQSFVGFLIFTRLSRSCLKQILLALKVRKSYVD